MYSSLGQITKQNRIACQHSSRITWHWFFVLLFGFPLLFPTHGPLRKELRYLKEFHGPAGQITIYSQQRSWYRFLSLYTQKPISTKTHTIVVCIKLQNLDATKHNFSNLLTRQDLGHFPRGVSTNNINPASCKLLHICDKSKEQKKRQRKYWRDTRQYSLR